MFFGAALPGHRRDPDARAAAAAGPARAEPPGGRGGPPFGFDQPAGGHARLPEGRHHLRGDRHDHRRRPLPGSPGVPLHRRRPAARDLHRRVAGAGHRHCGADVADRPLPRAGHLPGRRGAGQQRVPSRAGKQHRAIQGAAAGALLHHGGRRHRYGLSLCQALVHLGADAGRHRGQGRHPLAAGPDVPPEAAAPQPVRAGAGPGR